MKDILSGNFDINGVIKDIYVGELIGYDYCGKKYTTDNGEHAQYIVCTEAGHTDNADGYHFHYDECTLGHTDHEEAGWYKKNADGTHEKVGVVEGVMADIRLGYILGNGDVKFGNMFGSLKLGDVLGYDYCDMEGTNATKKCTVEDHTTATSHDKIKTLTWYVKESNGKYRMANALERTLANVPMKDILNGEFNVDNTLNKLKLGNLMNYEYCGEKYTTDSASDKYKVCDKAGESGHTDNADGYHYHYDTCMLGHGDNDHVAGWYKENGGVWEYIGQEVYCDGGEKFCGIEGHDHTNNTFKGWYHYDAKTGKWVINNDGVEQGKNSGNNILLCMIDRSVNDFRGSNFTQDLIDDINNYVLIGDIYDMSAVTGPIKLISPNTKIGEISDAVANVMSNATAGELYANKLLPVTYGTAGHMSEVYGAVVLYKYDESTDTWSEDAVVTKSGTESEARAALSNREIAELKPKAGDADYLNKLAKYEKAVGEYYWKSLKINQLVDVLLYSANFA